MLGSVSNNSGGLLLDMFGKFVSGTDKERERITRTLNGGFNLPSPDEMREALAGKAALNNTSGSGNIPADSKTAISLGQFPVTENDETDFSGYGSKLVDIHAYMKLALEEANYVPKDANPNDVSACYMEMELQKAEALANEITAASRKAFYLKNGYIEGGTDPENEPDKEDFAERGWRIRKVKIDGGKDSYRFELYGHEEWSVEIGSEYRELSILEIAEYTKRILESEARYGKERFDQALQDTKSRMPEDFLNDGTNETDNVNEAIISNS